MGRRIRWLGLVLILCFTLILLQLVNIQVRQASSLNASSENPRNITEQYDNNRGMIRAANGAVLAKSVKVPGAGPDTDQYYRTYPTGTLFSGIVGYSSKFRGTAGVEYVYNTQLLPHKQTATTLSQLLSPPAPTPDDVTLTVQPTLQRVAKTALVHLPGPNKDGAVVVLNPKTGAVLAMYSSPELRSQHTLQPDNHKRGGGEQGRLHTQGQGRRGLLARSASGHLVPASCPGRPSRWSPARPSTTSNPTLANFTFPVSGCHGSGSIPTTTNVIRNDSDTTNGATAVRRHDGPDVAGVL